MSNLRKGCVALSILGVKGHPFWCKLNLPIHSLLSDGVSEGVTNDHDSCIYRKQLLINSQNKYEFMSVSLSSPVWETNRAASEYFSSEHAAFSQEWPHMCFVRSTPIEGDNDTKRVDKSK